MSHEHEHPTVTRGAKMFGGGLILASLALTAAVQLGYLDRQAVPEVARMEAGAQAEASRDLRFVMNENDMLSVVDASSGEEIVKFADGDGGFVRGALRGLGRDRLMHDVGADAPYTLTRWSDGSISLVDQGTGTSVEIGAFGADNRAAFEALLENA